MQKIQRKEDLTLTYYKLINLYASGYSVRVVEIP